MRGRTPNRPALQIVPAVNQLFSLIAHSLSCIGQWCGCGRGVFDMAIAGLGNGGVPTTNIKALAGELRFLKCGLADMQGRLDALLSEIGAELQGVQGESEPAAEVLADLFATNQVITVAEIASEPVMAEVPPRLRPKLPSKPSRSKRAPLLTQSWRPSRRRNPR